MSRKLKYFEQKDEQFYMFWRCICLCHDVVPIQIRGMDRTEYQGVSQDEVKFLEMSRHVGVGVLEDRVKSTLKVKVSDE